MATQARVTTRLPPEERRDEILEAAREVFAERGYQKASMREIARRAGITQAALYYHFENKEDLLIIILEQFSNVFYQALLGCMTRAQGPEAGLRSMLRTHIDVIGARRKDIKILVEDKVHIESQKLGSITQKERDILNLYTSCLDALLSSGRISGQSPTVLSLGIIGMMNSLYHWYREDGPLGLEELGEVLLGIITGGLFGAGDEAVPATTSD
ncbi:MAG TPA: TetR/AcrR family transcriptional regulator [Alphaproteobacteria bacterium]|jgi:AcrR family transcriptional regulator|nr:TetR/AcrR family transcriptional regulator [Alphaproteobacteria bacterium]